MKSNPTDNQTPQPVDSEIDEILKDFMKTIKVTQNPTAYGEYAHRLHYNLNDTKARLLQWGTRQRIDENTQWKDTVKFWQRHITANDLKKRNYELQASLKDGGTK